MHFADIALLEDYFLHCNLLMACIWINDLSVWDYEFTNHLCNQVVLLRSRHCF